MLNKKVLIILLFCSIAISYVKSEDQEGSKAWSYTPVSSSDIITPLRSLYNQMVNGKPNGKPIYSIEIRTQNPQLKVWANRKWIEVETEIDKSWFNQIQKTITYLAKCKKYLELAKFNKKLNTSEAQVVMQNYTLALKKFKELIDNPTKVDRNKLSTLKRQRRDWLQVMRKKEKERLEKERYEKQRAR